MFSLELPHRSNSNEYTQTNHYQYEKKIILNYLKYNKASQAIQSPRTVPFFLLVSLLDGYSFPNVLVKGIVAFKR